MELSFRTFQLAFIKALSRLNGLRGNNYSNEKLNAFQDNLFQLAKELQSQILSPTFNQEAFDDFVAYPEFIFFIENGAEFLEDSILNLTPFETIFCLKKALSDWTSEPYEIVTSLQHGEYSFSHALSCEEAAYILIEDEYNIKFQSRLIQISIPKHEANNYLFNVTLYHELGHFIDKKFGISSSFVNKYWSEIEDEAQRKLENHFSEYFADIFAAQYIGNSVAHYLSYYAGNEPESETHPSTYDRIDVITEFIDGCIDDERVQSLIEHSNERMKVELKVRYIKKELSYSDFKEYIPPIINSIDELHGLFDIGWDIWLRSEDYYPNLNLEKRYLIINNLIEKSISNHMVTKEWDKCVQDVSD